MAQISDRDLAKAIKTSDQMAFKIFFERYYDRLFRFLWRKTRDEDRAQDLVQETFMRIWKSRQNLNADKILVSYLYKTAHNLAINHLKTKAKRQSYLDGQIDISSVELSADSIDTVEADDLFKKSLAELSPAEREVFTLSRFECLRYKEIAEALGISVKTVESRMSKALKKLKKIGEKL